MAEQRLTLNKRTPVVIETPEGMLQIDFHGNRKVTITLPGGMVAHMGADRAWKTARFLSRREDGSAMPTYSALTPKVDKSGKLVGIESAKIRRLASA